MKIQKVVPSRRLFLHFQNGYEDRRFKQGDEIYACGFGTLLVRANNFYCWIEQARLDEQVLRVFASQPLVFCDNVLPSSSHLLEIYYSFSRLSVDPHSHQFTLLFFLVFEDFPILGWKPHFELLPAYGQQFLAVVLPALLGKKIVCFGDVVSWTRNEHNCYGPRDHLPSLEPSQPQLLWIAVADTILNSRGRDSRSHS